MRRMLIAPVEPVRRETRLSHSDDLLGSMTPFIAFCYRQPLDPTRLMQTLTRVLRDYPAYAGRMFVRGATACIDHQRGGAVFEIEKRLEPMQQLVTEANTGNPTVVCPRISPLRASLGMSTLFAARWTQAADGSVLGITWHHPVGDLQSTLLLMRAWAMAYRGLDYERPLDVPDRELYLEERMPDPATAVTSARVLPLFEWLRLIGHVALTPTRRVHLEFRWDELANIQAAASRLKPVTLNDALCAHLLSVLRRLENRQSSSPLVVTVNNRKRAGLPANWLGNPLNTLSESAGPGDDSASIAARLRTRIDEYSTKHIGYHATARMAAAHPKRLDRMRVIIDGFDPYLGSLIVSNWTGFGLYDLAFADDRPVEVFCRALEVMWFATIYDSPANAGITLSIELPKHLAGRLTGPEGRALLKVAPPPRPQVIASGAP